jgi:hypothetical protein
MMWRSTMVLTAVLGALVPTRSPAADEPAPPKIEYRDDRLTLRVENTPVGDVLEEIRRQSGAELRGQVPDAKVSVQFDAVPLKDALPRLLGENFTLTYAEDGRLKAIELKGGPGAPTAPPVATAGTAADDPANQPTPPKWMKVYHTFENRDRVPVQGKLAELFGKDQANWDLLMNTAIGYEDARLRAQAMRAALAALEANSELRDAAAGALGDMSDAELAAFARHNCKHMAESFVKSVARETNNREWRARAGAVLRQLRLQARQAAATPGG